MDYHRECVAEKVKLLDFFCVQDIRFAIRTAGHSESIVADSVFVRLYDGLANRLPVAQPP
jgi:hypothetical protein